MPRRVNPYYYPKFAHTHRRVQPTSERANPRTAHISHASPVRARVPSHTSLDYSQRKTETPSETQENRPTIRIPDPRPRSPAPHTAMCANVEARGRKVKPRTGTLHLERHYRPALARRPAATPGERALAPWRIPHPRGRHDLHPRAAEGCAQLSRIASRSRTCHALVGRCTRAHVPHPPHLPCFATWRLQAPARPVWILS